MAHDKRESSHQGLLLIQDLLWLTSKNAVRTRQLHGKL